MRREGVLDVHIEPQEILFGVRVEVVVKLRRRRDFPPVKRRFSRLLVAHSSRAATLLDILAAVLHIDDFQAIAEGGKRLHQDSLLDLLQVGAPVFKSIRSEEYVTDSTYAWQKQSARRIRYLFTLNSSK